MRRPPISCTRLTVAEGPLAQTRHVRGTRFRDELRDFWRFIRHPRFGPRLPGRHAVSGWWEDWFPNLSVGRLLKWAFFLWMINLVFLGPIAVAAAGAG